MEGNRAQPRAPAGSHLRRAAPPQPVPAATILRTFHRSGSIPDFHFHSGRSARYLLAYSLRHLPKWMHARFGPSVTRQKSSPARGRLSLNAAIISELRNRCPHRFHTLQMQIFSHYQRTLGWCMIGVVFGTNKEIPVDQCAGCFFSFFIADRCGQSRPCPGF
jgi:hypothetical protein